MVKVLWETPGKSCAKSDRREFDDENVVIAFMSSNVKPVGLEAHEHRMVWVFDVSEISELHSMLLSGSPIMVDYHNVVSAKSKWRDGLFMLRSYLKSNAGYSCNDSRRTGDIICQ